MGKRIGKAGIDHGCVVEKGYYMWYFMSIDDAEAAIVELQSHIDSQSLPEEKDLKQVQVNAAAIFEETLSLANLL